MKLNPQLTAVSVLLGLSGVSHADLTTTTGAISFTGSATVTASEALPFQGPNFVPSSVTNSNNGANVATVGVSKFNAATGVLTAVDLQLTSSRKQTVSGFGSKTMGRARDISGNGTSTASFSAAGASLSFAPAITHQASSCSLTHGHSADNCNFGPDSSAVITTNGHAAVNNSNLNDYVGAGSINTSLSLPDLSVTSTVSNIGGGSSNSSATNLVDWSGDIEATYSYLLHAVASFNAGSAMDNLTLDFGTVAQNSIATLNFDLFNLAGENRTGLDLDAINGTGDDTAFGTGLTAFSGLAAADNDSFIASLLTDTAGDFSAQYTLQFSDADTGASDTHQNTQLTLNLVGSVAPVPVPAAVWLFASGLLGLVNMRRR